ncbi:MAG: hypothetical protein P8168_12495 [Deltaproteobacteria bacterium]
MQKKMLLILVVLAMGTALLLPGVAAANLVLTFDDLTAAYPIPQATPLPDNYGGFSWSGTGGYWGLVANSDYRGIYRNNFNFPSNPNIVTNESPDQMGAPTLAISHSTPFTFEGAYFSAWTGYGGSYYGANSLTIIGELGGEVVGKTTISLYAGPLSWYAIGFTNIDSLTFMPSVGTNGGRYFVMDNFTDVASPVPIPGSLALLGTGLLGLGLMRFRKV